MSDTKMEVEKEVDEEVEEESEEEEEEEETLVLVELHGVIDSEILAQESFGKFSVLGMDSERPVMQVENLLFSGEYENTFGTAVFFEEEEKRLKCDPVFCKKPQRMLRYSCSTNKQLSLKRVFVSEKNVSKEGQDSHATTTITTQAEKEQYQMDSKDSEMATMGTSQLEQGQEQDGTDTEGEMALNTTTDSEDLDVTKD